MELTGIRQKVFLDRYALKDEAGKPIEKTPEEMWRRVAHAIAKVEPKDDRADWEEQFYKSMENFVFVPGGRILSGAGSGYKVTFYNCLPPDQEVLTPNGYKPISEVKVGDEVITSKKRARRVNRVFVRKTEEPLCIIKPTKMGFDDVRLTGQHPVLAIKNAWVNRHRSRDGLHLKEAPQWINARDLRKGDFVAVAWNQQIGAVSKIHLREYLPETFSTQGDVVIKRQLKKPVKEEIDIDEKFMLLAGTWLGEGCVTHRTGSSIPAGIQITFNARQREWAEEIAGIMEETFAVVPTVREDRWGQKLIQVRVESYPVGLFFKNFFGAYSYKKRIPQVLMEQPKERILPLIKGLFRSDGYLSKNNLGIAISNKELAVQLHTLLLRTGRFFTIFQNNAKGGRHETYRVSAGVSQANGLCEYIFGEAKTNAHHDQDYFLIHDDLFWVRIASIDTATYKGKVYDLEVEEDHSFITGGIVVSNCFVIPSPHDSRQGILATLSQMVEIMSRGGGVGINLSSLRPRGARVKKVNGFSSGPCNWAELFSVATKDIIQQGGSRRGALMLMLWDWHPDVEEFITVKQDLSRINGANLSVCVSDALMEAVKNDAEWQLVFPDTKDPDYDEKWDGYLPNWIALGKKPIVHKTVKARQLWDLIAQAAWRSAEPGVVFMERYNKWFNNSYFEYINCVNPCVTGDTMVTTTNGIRSISDLYQEGKPFAVIVDGKQYLSSAVVKTGTKPVYRLKTREGYELRLTHDHKVYTPMGKLPARELKARDRLLLNSGGSFGTHGTLEEGRVLGWLVGDGSMKEDVATLYFYRREKEELAPRFAAMVAAMVDGEQVAPRAYPIGPQHIEKEDKAVIESVRLWRIAKRYGLSYKNKYLVPQVIFTGSEAIQRGFLQGLFSSDGHVAGTPEKGVSVRLTSVSKSLLVDIQRLLLNFGIVSRLYEKRRDEGMRTLPDGRGGSRTYHCQAYHDLVIARADLHLFASLIGFLQKEKQERLQSLLATYVRGRYKKTFTATFDRLEEDGVEDVYDITVASVHRFAANGIMVSNCGEEGLPNWGVCNLTSINLAALVDEDGKMDYERLAEVARVGVRFQDDVIDADFYVFDEIRKVQQQGERRIGLGTMGLGDALIKMKLRYGAQESLAVIEKIYRTIRDAAYEASVKLAKEKGPFPKIDITKHTEGYFIKQLPGQIRKKMKKYGVRNSVILQQAPTGSTSLLAGVSSGIEPVYEFEFIRRDRLGEHVLRHPRYEAWYAEFIKREGREPTKQDRPTYFVSANDLTPEDHVYVQAVIQKYVDASISKTVNAPTAHTVEDVKKLYSFAYELGCKGITYMREGSRPGVLSRKEQGKDEMDTLVKVETPTVPEVKPRPMVVAGSTYQVETPVGQAYVTLNTNGGNQPLEVFINVGKAGSDVTAMAEAMGRLISLSLRMASPIPAIERARKVAAELIGIGGARSLGFGENRVRSLPDAVAKVIDRHFGFFRKQEFANESRAETSKDTPTGNGQVSRVDILNADGQVATDQLGGNPDQSMTAPSQQTIVQELPAGTAARMVTVDLCPSCGEGSLVFEEACKKCYSCGYSEC